MRLFLAIMGADGGSWIRYILKGEPPEPSVKGLLQGGSLPNALRPLVAGMAQSRGQRRFTFLVRSLGSKSAGEYWKTVEERNKYRARFLAAMERFDAFICPPYAVPAFPHGHGVNLHVGTVGSYSTLYNVLGMPAGVMAATRVRKGEESDRATSKDSIEKESRQVEENSAGLPVGVQVVARHWREDIVLAVMAALEEHFRIQPDYPKCPVTLA